MHNYLPFLPERMKIEKFEKLAADLHNRTEYFIRTRNLKQALNHKFALKKVYELIKLVTIERRRDYLV